MNDSDISNDNVPAFVVGDRVLYVSAGELGVVVGMPHRDMAWVLLDTGRKMLFGLRAIVLAPSAEVIQFMRPAQAGRTSA